MAKKQKEVPIIDFDNPPKEKAIKKKYPHLDADIYMDGTSSVPGIGKPPKTEKKPTFKEMIDEFLKKTIID